jgi:hypothetical protein
MDQIPRDAWAPRFAKKLRRLHPGVQGDDAMSVALAGATYPDAQDRTPEEAVEIYLRGAARRRGRAEASEAGRPVGLVAW